jgi:hypothetical protein
MYELMWFVGGALIYQLLAKTLKVAQIYMFFQEIHIHALMMLEAASQDLDAARELKAQLINESELEKEQVDLINTADEQAIETWRVSAVFKIQHFIPGAFRDTIKYDTWDGLKKHLKNTLKK